MKKQVSIERKEEVEMKEKETRDYQLRVDLPFLKKGRIFVFENDTGYIYAFLDGKVAENPLRTGLAGYLWLLLTEPDKYFEEVSNLKYQRER